MSIIPELYSNAKTIFHFRKTSHKWQVKQDKKAPKTGDMAPDFTLRDVTGTQSVTLSEFRSRKPVALVFGSYTWPPFVRGTVRIHELYEQYHDQVQFLSIYIREAHPKDGWWLGVPLTKRIFDFYEPRVSMAHYDPKTMEERRAVAGECETALQYGIRTYVDEMDDKVNESYAAWPTRLYLIGLDGRVVYPGAIGPIGMKPNELKVAMDKYLTQIQTA